MTNTMTCWPIRETIAVYIRGTGLALYAVGLPREISGPAAYRAA